jgi:hypothetical protein
MLRPADFGSCVTSVGRILLSRSAPEAHPPLAEAFEENALIAPLQHIDTPKRNWYKSYWNCD